MTTLYITLAIYYFVGIAYSYEVYKKYNLLDFMTSTLQCLYVAFIFAPLWVIHFIKPKVRKIRNYITLKREQWNHVLPHHKTN